MRPIFTINSAPELKMQDRSSLVHSQDVVMSLPMYWYYMDKSITSGYHIIFINPVNDEWQKKIYEKLN